MNNHLIKWSKGILHKAIPPMGGLEVNINDKGT